MSTDLYDLIRYKIVPPVFLAFFTIITQVFVTHFKNIFSTLANIAGIGRPCQSSIVVYDWLSGVFGHALCLESCAELLPMGFYLSENPVENIQRPCNTSWIHPIVLRQRFPILHFFTIGLLTSGGCHLSITLHRNLSGFCIHHSSSQRVFLITLCFPCV